MSQQCAPSVEILNQGMAHGGEPLEPEPALVAEPAARTDQLDADHALCADAKLALLVVPRLVADDMARNERVRVERERRADALGTFVHRKELADTVTCAVKAGQTCRECCEYIECLGMEGTRTSSYRRPTNAAAQGCRAADPTCPRGRRGCRSRCGPGARG